MKNTEYSLRDMKDVLDLSAKAEKAIVSIKKLEIDVRKEELTSSRAKGGSEIGYYEINR